jgi:riboflavin synthase
VFTGIIEMTGSIASIDPLENGARLTLDPLPTDNPLKRGESIAVNGVCLTALPNADGSLTFDVSPETLRVTNLGSLKRGSKVNLERSLALGDRLSGHLVQGHVDATGSLLSIKREGEFATFRWSYPREFGELVVPKGSIAVDGISLTIVDPDGASFEVALIPETLAKTNLGASKVGDPVNLEFDVMAKFARQMLKPYVQAGA